jgi:hypothetical protein
MASSQGDSRPPSGRGKQQLLTKGSSLQSRGRLRVGVAGDKVR